MLGRSIGLGISITAETLCSQAYGALKYKNVGIYYQRTLTVVIAAAIPISVAFAFSKYILIFIGASEIVAEYG